MLVPAAAHADTTGTGDLSGDGHLQVSLTVSTSDTLDAPDTSARSLLNWQVLGDGVARTGDLSGMCLVPATPPRFGYQYRLLGSDATGSVVVDLLECVPFPGEGGPAPPPAPPAFPSFGAAWAQAALPVATPLVDPPARGITGLATYVRAAGAIARKVAIHATVDGYTITGTADLADVRISIDGGPAEALDTAQVIFETKGDHRIALRARWHGTALLAGGVLVAPIRTDLGIATITATVSYHVDEVRTELVH